MKKDELDQRRKEALKNREEFMAQNAEFFAELHRLDCEIVRTNYMQCCGYDQGDNGSMVCQEIFQEYSLPEGWVRVPLAGCDNEADLRYNLCFCPKHAEQAKIPQPDPEFNPC